MASKTSGAATVAGKIEEGAKAVQAAASALPGETAGKVASVAGEVAKIADAAQTELFPLVDNVALSLQRIGDKFHATVTVGDKESTHKDSDLSSILQTVKNAFRTFGAIVPKPKNKD